jgi:hypothetical protein
MRTVVAAALCIALLVGCTNGSASGPDTSDLVGSWKLIDLQGFDGAAHTTPDAAFSLSFSLTGVSIGRAGCLSTDVDTGVGTVKFGQNWRSRLLTGCPQLGKQQGKFLFEEILNGTTSWAIRHDELTLSKSGTAAAFQRVGHA